MTAEQAHARMIARKRKDQDMPSDRGTPPSGRSAEPCRARPAGDVEADTQHPRDRAARSNRGKGEAAPPRPGDITSVEDLAVLAGRVVKYTKDRGATWRYAVLWQAPERFADNSWGYATDEEVARDGVNLRASLTDRDFARGACAREAPSREYNRTAFSFDASPPLPDLRAGARPWATAGVVLGIAAWAVIGIGLAIGMPVNVVRPTASVVALASIIAFIASMIERARTGRNRPVPRSSRW